MKRIRRLIKDECCNYDKGCCLLLDNGYRNSCIQSYNPYISCKWLINAVLPIDKPLEAEIFKNSENIKKCIICGESFVSKSNRSKYCKRCAIKVHRNQKTLSERKRRSKVDN